MDRLLDLGSHLSVAILSEWLDPRAFVALDSALCNTNARKIVKDSVLQFPALFGKVFFNTSLPLSLPIFEWLERRQLSLSCVGNFELKDAYLAGWSGNFCGLLAKADEVRSVEVTEIRAQFFICRQLLEKMTSLQKLSLRDITESAWLVSAVSSHSLTKVSLQALNGVDQAAIHALLVKQKYLEELTLGIAWLETSVLESIQNPALRAFDFRLCRNIRADHVRRFCTNKLEHIALSGMDDAFLKHVAVHSGTSLLSLPVGEPRNVVISSEGTSALLRACTALRNVCLDDWPHVNDDSLLTVARNNPHLRGLNVRQTTSILYHRPLSVSADCLCAAVEACPLLEDIWLPKRPVKERVLYAIATHCPRLKALRMAECDVEPAVLSRLLEKCPHLDTLRVKATDSLRGLYTGGHQLSTLEIDSTDSHLCELLPRCPNLTSLSFMGNDSFIGPDTLTERSLVTAVGCCKLTHFGCEMELVLSKKTVDAIIASQARTLRVIEGYDVILRGKDRKRLLAALPRCKFLE